LGHSIRWTSAPARFAKLQARGLVSRQEVPRKNGATVAVITDKGKLLIERIALLAVMQQGATKS
jgi:predicted transcriptional regulator